MRKGNTFKCFGFVFMETEKRGLSQEGGAPVLKVLVRVGVPVWDHRGTQKLVVAVHGSPPSPADGASGELHNVTSSLRHVRRQGEPLPRAASGTFRFAVQGRHGQRRQKASRSKGCRGSLAVFLFPLVTAVSGLGWRGAWERWCGFVNSPQLSGGRCFWNPEQLFG